MPCTLVNKTTHTNKKKKTNMYETARHTIGTGNLSQILTFLIITCMPNVTS